MKDHASTRNIRAKVLLHQSANLGPVPDPEETQCAPNGKDSKLSTSPETNPLSVRIKRFERLKSAQQDVEIRTDEAMIKSGETLPNIASKINKVVFEDAHKHQEIVSSVTGTNLDPKHFDIPLDTSIQPSKNFLSLLKKTLFAFCIFSEMGRRTILDNFLRDIVCRREFKKKMLIYPEFRVSASSRSQDSNNTSRISGICDYAIGFCPEPLTLPLLNLASSQSRLKDNGKENTSGKVWLK